MVIAANVLNAIGGAPQINRPEFVPIYPGPLPMHIGEDLIVGLAPLSRDVLFNTFMRIEEPEDPLEFPVRRTALAVAAQEYATIGDFYQAIIDKIQELGPSCITGDPARQVVNEQWFPRHKLFPIATVAQAVAGLTLIVQQGEGTTKTPLDPEGGYAYYYRYAEIYHGRRLRRDASVPEGYSYSGEPISLDPEGIWDLVPNSTVDVYKPGTRARRLVDQFNVSYTNLLNALQETCTGHPERLNAALGVMYELTLQAQAMVEVTDPTLGKQVAPAFQYAAVYA